jgi:putative oxidoreductase
MDIAFLIGRIIFGGYWLMSALNHFKNLNHMSEYAKAKGTPFPKLAVAGTGVNGPAWFNSQCLCSRANR